MMREHKRVCLVEPVPCPYQNVGCSARPRRQDIPQHNLEAMGNHLHLTISFIAKQRREIVQKDKEINHQNHQIVHKDDKIKQQRQEIAQKEQEIAQRDKEIAKQQYQKIKHEGEKEQHKKSYQQIQGIAQHHPYTGLQYKMII